MLLLQFLQDFNFKRDSFVKHFHKNVVKNIAVDMFSDFQD